MSKREDRIDAAVEEIVHQGLDMDDLDDINIALEQRLFDANHS
jgi:hypothetical protein